MARLDELGDSDAMKRGVESALKASKQYVNPLINQAMASGNLPAGGRYSSGGTEQSISTDTVVDWEGMTGAIKVGFEFSESGLKSIYLMYGTPKMSPVTGLYEAVYGNRTQREIGKIQAETLNKVIKRIMEGG